MADFKTVVVGTDFSPCAQRAVGEIQKLAPQLGVRRIHLVTVVQTAAWVTPPMAAAADLTAVALEEAKRRLEEVDLGLPDVQITREARLGSPPRELAAAAHELNARLIVVATHGRTGLTRAVLGSVTSALVRVADTPVLVVPAEGALSGSFHRVLAAVDLSPVSRLVLAAAGAFARTSPDGRVRALSTFEHPLLSADDGELLPHYATKEEIAELGEQHRAEVERVVHEAKLEGVPVDIDVVSKAPPFRVILDVAQLTEADLVVVGTSGRNAWHRMIVGSTANRVLSEAERPVLVIPHVVEQEIPEGEGIRSRSSGHAPLPAGG